MTAFSSLFLVLCCVAMTSAKVITDFSELSFDANDRITTNYLFYPTSSACADSISGGHIDEREIIGVNDELAALLLGRPVNPSKCSMVCVDKGYRRDHIPHPLPFQVGQDVADIDAFILDNCKRTELNMINFNVNPVNVYWLNDQDQRSLVMRVSNVDLRNQNTQTTYLGHRFVVVDSVTNEDLRSFTVTHMSYLSIGTPPANRAFANEVDTLRHLNATVRDTFESEWKKSHRVQRTFSQFGFQKTKLPKDIFASMSAFYYNNQNEGFIEQWTNNGLFVNWWEADAVIVRMPENLKQYWQSRLQRLVEDWTGVEMEPTSIYGMRKYQDGARLLTHVDRETTHAASMIINVEQFNIREPWKVEIYDFADRLHEIVMEPGDLVFYESARCLHGRMQTLQGAYYVNIFSHYRPAHSQDQWLFEDNPIGTPQPVLDVGDCEVTPDGQSVTCSKSDVTSISPKMQTLHGAQDLYDFWVELGAGGKNLQNLINEQDLLNHMDSTHSEL